MKRIIDLDEVMINGNKYYKVVGCKTMFFDQWGFDNLTKELDDKPLLNKDFVVIETNNSYMTVGKLYHVENGKFNGDNGLGTYPCCRNLYTTEDLVDYFKDDFDGGNTKIAVLNYR